MAKKKAENTDINIEFIKSPTGKFNMGYAEGDIVTMNVKQAEIVIEAGYAKKV